MTKKLGLALRLPFFALVISMFFSASFASDITYSSPEERLIVIGTGSSFGVYYQVGSALCRLINSYSEKTNLHCSVQSTTGSIENIDLILNNTIDIGFSQGDWLYHAVNSSSFFRYNNPKDSLRKIVNLYDEVAVILVRDDSDIKSLDDIKNKRFGVGTVGSGTNKTFSEILRFKNWETKDFLHLSESDTMDNLNSLCTNQIDAMISIYGSPNQSFVNILESCNLRIIPIMDDGIKKMIDFMPYYKSLLVTNSGFPQDLILTENGDYTLGITSVLFTEKNLDPEIVSFVSQIITDNISSLRDITLSMKNVSLDEMFASDELVPMHSGVKPFISSYKK